MQTDYFWLDDNYHALTSLYQRDRHHHAVLIQTLPGLDNHRTIEMLIAWLMCANQQEKHACQTCHTCRLVQAKNHPDVHVICLEKDKSSIGVDQIRRLTNAVYERAQQGHNKVILIQNAELLTESAANALLKTLEEPPEKTYFLLTCTQIAALMPTIRSRCLQIALTAPNIDAGFAWLQSQKPQFTKNQLMTALLLNQHAPINALELVESEAWATRGQFFEALWSAATTTDFFALLPALNQPDIETRLYWFSAVVMDAMKYQLNAIPAIINRDQSRMIKYLAQWPLLRLESILSAIQAAGRILQSVTSVNKELILSDLLLTLDTL